MKKILKFILPFCFISLGLFMGFIMFYDKHDDTYNDKNLVIKKDRSLSMMLETGSGTGVYELTTRSTWPSEGYVFNASLSKCENGGNLKWDDNAKVVLMSGNVSDKCYVYFDKYDLAVITNLTEEVTYNSIKVTALATYGTNNISKFKYSINNGEYVETGSNIHLFSGLNSETTYTIKVIAIDSLGKESDVFSKSIKTGSYPLANYIKSQYTGTQGANGIYLHNGTIKSGTTVIDANDGSYRYAGANPGNYVCFGSTATICPTDNLYRIIGVFGDQVKLIKYDYATSNLLGTNGGFKNTYNNSGFSGTNKGNNASSVIGAYAWNIGNGTKWSESTTYSINLNNNFATNVGIEWANMIATATWIVGGSTYSKMAGSATAAIIYQNEIISPESDATVSNKIGLMYASDYGYAAAPSYWTYRVELYYQSIDNNWMHMGLYEWTITDVGSSDACSIYSSGSIDCDHGKEYNRALRPTFYLNSNVQYDKGSGTSSDPIRIKL